MKMATWGLDAKSGGRASAGPVAILLLEPAPG
jgi:hypothetical protein